MSFTQISRHEKLFEELQHAKDQLNTKEAGVAKVECNIIVNQPLSNWDRSG